MLVGREAEVAALASAWGEAESGVPVVVLVGGEAGIGKTALLNRFTAGLPDGVLVLRGQCVDLGGQGLAYAPLVGVLSDLVRQAGRESVIRLAGAWRADVARLVPDLGPAATDAEAGRSRLFQGVVSLLEQAASRQPVVLVVEDLHWADESTLELLRFAVRTLRDGRLMLAGSYRSDELTRRHPLTPVLADLVTAERVTQLVVPRLGADETAGLVRRRLDGPVDTALVGSLVARSEGVPFYAEELARTAVQGAGGLPSTLAEVLSARLGELTAVARQVMEAAAVGGAEVSEADVGTVLDLPGDRVDAALREGIDRQILTMAPGSAGFGFRHALLREAVLDSLLPGRQATLHRRWAQHLAATPAAQTDAGRAVRIAQHWHAAHDTNHAFTASLAAARLLRSAAAPGEELRMLEQALSVWNAVADAEAMACCDQASLQEAAARAASQAGDWERAMQFQTAALSGVDPDTDPLRYASMRLERTRLTEPLGQEVTDETERVLAMLPTAPPDTEAGRIRARALAMLARGRILQGNYIEGERLARTAAEYARRAGEPRAEAHALSLLGNALDGLGRSEEALVVRYERRPLVERIDDPFAKAGDLHNVVITLGMLGRVRDAAAAAHEGRLIATDMGLARSEGASYASLEAESLLELGEWDAAMASVKDALALDPGALDVVELSILAATIAVWRGDRDAADLVERARLWFSRVDDAWFRLPFATLEARAALEADDASTALAVVAAAMHDPDAVFHPYSAGRFLHAAARTLASSSADADIAAPTLTTADLASKLDELPTGVETPVWHALCAAELAGPDQARERWSTCCGLLADVEGFAYERARALYRLGVEQHKAGLDEAPATLRTAQDHAERLRVLPLLWRILEVTRAGQQHSAVGAVSRRPAFGNPFGLTGREQEVLNLVGDGLSNSDIARRLFISPKTASVHISNILSKLGVSSRSQAADKARGLGLLASDQP